MFITIVLGTTMGFLNWLKRVFTRKCKYWKHCPYYYEESYTCNNGGGPYCGVFRKFENKGNEQNLN